MRELFGGAVLAVTMAACVAACAGHSSDQGGTPGGGTSGGAGGAVGSGGALNRGGASGGGTGAASGYGGFGGADAVVPQGGLNVSVTEPATPVAQMVCPASGITYLIGAPDAPTLTDPGESLISGESGSLITCSVMGNGQFAFSGALHATTAQGDTVSINFSNGSVAADGSGSADVAFYSPQLAASFAGTSCSVSVLDQQVKSGSIWATFKCQQIASPPSGLCGLSGELVFENCVDS